MQNKSILLPSVYLGNAAYYALLLNAKEVWIEQQEHFIKQSYRNRCVILSANGLLNLIVPISKHRNHTPFHEVRISYQEDWQKLHWRSIVSAYRSSPYFEYYEDQLQPFYENRKYEKLLDWNAALQERILKLLAIKVRPNLTDSYEATAPSIADFREMFSPKQEWSLNFKTYIQVFSSKMDFMPNLSIVDLLFNLGPETVEYLSGLNDD